MGKTSLLRVAARRWRTLAIAGTILVAAAVGGGAWFLAAQARYTRPTYATSADPGSDLTTDAGVEVVLDGTRSLRSPLEFWVADGDGVIEDALVRYREGRLIEHTGQLRSWRGTHYGWPVDFELVKGRIIGADTWNRQFYVLYADLGRVGRVGNPFPYKKIRSLAYDEATDTLYAADAETRQLLLVDTTSFALRRLGQPLELKDIAGMAYDAQRKGLLVVDQDTSALYSFDLATQKTAQVMSLPLHTGPFADAVYDELASFRGELYATYCFTEQGQRHTQLRRIDPVAKTVENVGPILWPTQGHALFIASMPEEVAWTVVEGPAAARIDNAHAIKTKAVFPASGAYSVRLSVGTGAGKQSRLLKVTVRPSAAGVASDTNRW